MRLIPITAHPANEDESARLVDGARDCSWSIYAVRGGFVLTIHCRHAVDAIFATQSAAHAAISEAMRLATIPEEAAA